MLRALCLDLMGVVLHDPYLEAIEAAVEVPLEEVWRRKDPHSWPEFECGRIDEAEFERRFWAADASLAFDAEAFHRVRRAGYRFTDGMESLIRDAGSALDLHVASNYPTWIEELRGRFRLDAYCDGVWASCHLGVRKPDPAFYGRLLEKVGHPPEACLFVDDRAVNVEAAEAVGMRGHLFTSADELRSRLAADGVPL